MDNPSASAARPKSDGGPDPQGGGATGQRIVIFAPNIRTGGGLVLLRALLEAHWPLAERCAFLDRRACADLATVEGRFAIEWVESGVVGRMRAEHQLARRSRPEDIVLCFHNLPPLFPVRGEVICYVQNAYVIGGLVSKRMTLRSRLRTMLERVIARRFRHRCSQFVVQTPTMHDRLVGWLGSGRQPIHILPIAPPIWEPFAEDDSGSVRLGDVRADFLFVSDGQPHKNHQRLFAAWQLLAEWGLYPTLIVTLDPVRDGALHAQVSALADRGLAIENVGAIPRRSVLRLYRQAEALIFPSLGESFGNPLFEAQALGVPILAPELDYVRDVCDPQETFDALSPRSIARAVQRFLGTPSDRVRVLDGSAFAIALLAAARSNSTGLSSSNWPSRASRRELSRK